MLFLYAESITDTKTTFQSSFQININYYISMKKIDLNIHKNMSWRWAKIIFIVMKTLILLKRNTQAKLPEYGSNCTIIIFEYYNQLMLKNFFQNSNKDFAKPLFSVKKTEI